MKVCLIQPHYSFIESEQEICFENLISLLDKCDNSLDVIVLPEHSDALADLKGKEPFYKAIKRNNERLLIKAKETAKRCGANVFVNAGYFTEKGIRNTTFAINKNGEIVGKYFKAHPAPSEVKTDSQGGHELDVLYSGDYAKPYVIEIDGLRYGFLTCYDFYFYENFARIAREKVDIIIGCSLQRTDSSETLETIGKFLCYNTNAYLLRASVSLGENSAVCGCSMAVSPKGEMLLNMGNDVGLGIVEIDPTKKFFKPAGHGGKMKAHYEYIEQGRRPWLYRNGGPSIVKFDEEMQYPRLCAHRGFNTVAPENSLVSLGAAVALGAQEIEFDIWATKDGVLVSSHDSTLERVSTGKGNIFDYTYEQLLAFDFGIKHGEKFKGLKICTFEEILKKFAGRVIMNCHVKIWDGQYSQLYIEEIVSLVREYDCEKHLYFMSSNDEVLKKIRKDYPDLRVCVGFNWNKEDPLAIVKRAIDIGAYKVQLFKPYFTQETIDFAHENNILCNVFWADDKAEARRYLEMGIDTVLTNDYLAIYNEVEDLLNNKNSR